MGLEEPTDYGIPDFDDMAKKAMRECKDNAILHIACCLNCTNARAEIVANVIAAAWWCCEDAGYAAVEEFYLPDTYLLALLGKFDKFSTLYFKMMEQENE